MDRFRQADNTDMEPGFGLYFLSTVGVIALLSFGGYAVYEFLAWVL